MCVGSVNLASPFRPFPTVELLERGAEVGRHFAANFCFPVLLLSLFGGTSWGRQVCVAGVFRAHAPSSQPLGWGLWVGG